MYDFRRKLMLVIIFNGTFHATYEKELLDNVTKKKHKLNKTHYISANYSISSLILNWPKYIDFFKGYQITLSHKFYNKFASRFTTYIFSLNFSTTIFDDWVYYYY